MQTDDSKESSLHNSVNISCKKLSRKTRTAHTSSVFYIFFALKCPVCLSIRSETTESSHLPFTHTLSLDSPACSRHSQIKMEKDSISLPAKPDTLTAADSTTAAYTFTSSQSRISIGRSDESYTLQKFSPKSFISLLPRPVKHQRQ